MSESVVPRDLLDAVVAWFQPRQVILFGSLARGQARPDSDIDLLVVLDDDAPAEKLGYKAGMAARREYDEPVDIVPCRADTFRRLSRVVGTLAYAARTEGIVVYERR
jgi:uncharacterized protein